MMSSFAPAIKEESLSETVLSHLSPAHGISTRTTTAVSITDGNERAETATPYSGVTDVPPRYPDITMKCVKCCEFIDMRLLQEHRRYHEALETLRFEENDRPRLVHQLVTKRQVVQKELATAEDDVYQRQQLAKLDNAFELLRMDLNGTYARDHRFTERTHVHDAHGHAQSVSAECVLAIGTCAVANERWKRQMEDAHVVRDTFGGDARKCFVALYDGHHGDRAARTAAHELHHALLHEMEKFDVRTRNGAARPDTCASSNDGNEHGEVEEEEEEGGGGNEEEREKVDEEKVNVNERVENAENGEKKDVKHMRASDEIKSHHDDSRNSLIIEQSYAPVLLPAKVRSQVNARTEECASEKPVDPTFDAFRAVSTGVVQRIIALCEDHMRYMGESSEDILYRKVYKPKPPKHQCIDECAQQDIEIAEKKSKRKRKKKRRNPFDVEMCAALDRAHKYTDMALSLGRDESSRVRWSGCSTVCCVIRDIARGEINYDINETISSEEAESVSLGQEDKIHSENETGDSPADTSLQSLSYTPDDKCTDKTDHVSPEQVNIVGSNVLFDETGKRHSPEKDSHSTDYIDRGSVENKNIITCVNCDNQDINDNADNVSRNGDADKVTRNSDADNVSRNRDADDVLRNGDADNVPRNGDADNVSHNGDRDYVFRNNGANNVPHNSGADNVSHNSGTDNVSGNSGADNVSRDSGLDNVSRNSGADNIPRISGVDNVSQNSGADNVSHNSGADNVSRNSGADNVSRNSGADNMSSIGGADNVSRISGADNVSRISGTDDVSQSRGADNVSHNSGADNVSRNNGIENVLRISDIDDVSRNNGAVNLSSNDEADNVLCNETIDVEEAHTKKENKDEMAKVQLDAPEPAPDDTKETKRPKESLIQLGVINIANAGNIHALLIRGNRPYQLSKDHTLRNPKERRRIIREGGYFCDSDKELRINGVLEATRGLGNHGDPGLKRCVITDPYTTTVNIDQHAQILLLASHGVWEVFSPEEVTFLLVQMLPCNQVKRSTRYDSDVLLGVKSNIAVDEVSVESAVPSDAHAVREQHSSKVIASSLPAIMSDDNLLVSKYASPKSSPACLSYSATSNQRQSAFENMPSAVPQRRTSDGLRVHVGSISSFDERSVRAVSHRTASPSIDSTIQSIYADEKCLARDMARRMAERLTQAALLAGAKDNVTVIVVLLPGSKILERSETTVDNN